MITHPPTFDELLPKEGLRRRLNLPSIRGVDELVRLRKIPVLRLGHRTVRFSWPAVEQALSRLTVNAVGGPSLKNQKSRASSTRTLFANSTRPDNEA